MEILDFSPLPIQYRYLKGQAWDIPIHLQENIIGSFEDYFLEAYIILNGTVIDTLNVSNDGIIISENGRVLNIYKDWFTLSANNSKDIWKQLIKGNIELQLFASDNNGKDSVPFLFKIEITETPDVTTERVNPDYFHTLTLVDGFFVKAATSSLYNLTVQKAGEAEQSAISANTSKVNAKASEDNAKTSETNSKTSENKAKTSETNAKTSEENASTYKNEAKTAKEIAEAKAVEAIAANNDTISRLPVFSKFVKGLQVWKDDEENKLAEFTDEGKLKALFDFALSKITFADLGTDVVALLNSILTVIPKDGSQFVSGRIVWKDDNENKLAEFTDEGKLKALFDFALSKITYADLGADVIAKFDSLFSKLAIEIDGSFLNYMRVYVDEADNILFAVKKDGNILALLQLPANSVSETNLTQELRAKIPSASFVAQNTYNAADVEFGEDDDLWRAAEVELPIKTNRTGIAFSRFSPLKTASIGGVNNTGYALEFRLGANLTIRGERYISDFSPILSSKLVTNKGIFYDSTVSLPANPTLGDYYICVFFYTNPQTRTLSGVTMSQWDILYWDGTNWQIQPCPVSGGSLKDGDYFDVLSDGKFWNLDLKAGNRLIFLGTKAGGGNNSPIWIAEKTGEYFLKGECNPAAFSVTSAKNYDLYIVSADGNYGGIDLKKGDYLFRLDGVWGKSEGNIVTVANNIAFNFSCTNAKQISVRRADKSTTQLTIKAKANVNMLSRMPNSDFVLYSDSMFGVNVGAKIATLISPRVATTQSFGGASSIGVASMIKSNIRNSDLYRGCIHVFWHGQNNQTDLTQIKSVALEMISLAGSQQSDFVMWSMLGQLSMSFNGTRMVCANHEDAFNRANNSRFVEIEDWYDSVITHRHFATRKAALASAVGRTRKSLHFPGMTEAQVASTYGIPPLSYFFNFSGISWNPDNLVFAGYYSTVALPDSLVGSNNDYYVRTGGGTVGTIIVKNTGVWTEHSYDFTHVTAEGGQALAEQFQQFILTKNI